MGRAIEISTRLSADELRALAREEGDRRAAMRMLAIANELDGYEREEAARLAAAHHLALLRSDVRQRVPHDVHAGVVEKVCAVGFAYGR